MSLALDAIAYLESIGRRYKIVGEAIEVEFPDNSAYLRPSRLALRSAQNKRAYQKRRLLKSAEICLTSASLTSRSSEPLFSGFQQDSADKPEPSPFHLKPLPERITIKQAKAQKFRPLTNQYGSSDEEQGLLKNVVVDQWLAGSDFALVICPADETQTSVWLKKIKRYKDVKQAASRHIVESARAASAKKKVTKRAIRKP